MLHYRNLYGLGLALLMLLALSSLAYAQATMPSGMVNNQPIMSNVQAATDTPTVAATMAATSTVAATETVAPTVAATEAMTPTVAATTAATSTVSTPSALPATGGDPTPWSSILLLAGGLALIGGFSLALFSRK